VSDEVRGGTGSESGAATAGRRLAEELSRALMWAERREGRSIDRGRLAKRLNISQASLYAYLSGATVPRAALLDRLLDQLGVTGRAVGGLASLRDAAETERRAARSGRAKARAVPSPRQLPAAPSGFVGRRAELAQLDALLADAGPGNAIAVVCGAAGIGKTSLAVHWSHHVAAGYADGQLYVDLRGFSAGPPVEPDTALDAFLLALGLDPMAIPAQTDAKSALFRSVLAHRKVLLVVDNARSAAQARPLLPGVRTCPAVVTSRDRLDGLVVREGAHRMPLDVLSGSESLTMLSRRVGADRLTSEPHAARELARLSAGLPLALGVLAARAASTTSLDVLVSALRDEGSRLDALGMRESDLDLRTVFRWSYDALPPDAARLFRLLGLHPGPEIDIRACGALVGADAPPRDLLDVLTATHLLLERAPGRFVLHDLLRVYAAEVCAREETAADRGAALERLAAYYLSMAEAADRHIQPVSARPAPQAEPSWLCPEPLISSYERAMAWFGTELATLVSVQRTAAEHALEPYAWRMAQACTVYARRSGHRALRAEIHRIALDAAIRRDDIAARATAERQLGDALAGLGRPQEALALVRASLAHCAAAKDEAGARHARLSLVRILEPAGRHRRALQHAEAALRSAEADGDPVALADALTATAKQRAKLGDAVESLALSRRALAHYARQGHAEGQANILMNIALAEQSLGNHGRAAAAIQRSLALDRMLGDRYWEALALDRLADVHSARGDEQRAHRYRLEAFVILEDLRHPRAEALRRALSGPAGDEDRATLCDSTSVGS
jgi:tetratricopeptide (TPR) repeat protein/transcriptional regulator with XRE-family HTH domain